MTRLPLALLVCLSLSGCALLGGDEDKDDGDDEESDTVVEGDDDGDGFGLDDDCDDDDADVHPDADEECDGVDNNCDGDVDEGVLLTWYGDKDDDGFGGPEVTEEACEQPDGMVENTDDCNDANPRVFPGADEQCNEVDDDCNGTVDDNVVTLTLYRDRDADRFGNPDESMEACVESKEWVRNDEDCNDAEPLINPAGTEICNEIDDDCNGVVDDGAASVEWFVDADGDKYGDPSSSIESCEDPGEGYAQRGNDCDDADPGVNPGADEHCDGVDEDCDGTVDDNAVDVEMRYDDADGDGFGDPSAFDYECDGVDNGLDCDDTDANEPQVADAASRSGDGSLAKPWPTIQEAIDAANMCVAVLPGGYVENIDFGGKDVDVFSIGGLGSTIIDGSGAGSVVTFQSGEGAGAELRGFTLTHGGGSVEHKDVTEECGSADRCTTKTITYCGGGIMIFEATPTLSDLKIEANELPPYSYVEVSDTETETVFSYGAGICVTGSKGTQIDGVDIVDNYADTGGGLYVGADAAADALRTRFLFNTAAYGAGAAVDSGAASFTNTIFLENEATKQGGAISSDSAELTIWNSTFVYNVAPVTAGGSIAAMGSSTLELHNSILFNSPAAELVLVQSGATTAITYNDAYNSLGGTWSGVTPGATNIEEDPLFVNFTLDATDNDDLHLAVGSLCINEGNPSTSYNDASDGSVNDMGAYGGPGNVW